MEPRNTRFARKKAQSISFFATEPTPKVLFEKSSFGIRKNFINNTKKRYR